MLTKLRDRLHGVRPEQEPLTEPGKGTRVEHPLGRHSHSIVAGGLPEMS